MTVTEQVATQAVGEDPPRSPAARRPRRRGNSSLVNALLVLVAATAAGVLLTAIAGKHNVVPLPILVDGAIGGLVASLFAAGILLVYRADRIITFAHSSLALSASILFVTLAGEHWPWWVAVPTTVLATVVAGAAIEVLVLRRFSSSPRLVATVATIGIGQLLVSLAFALPQWRFGVDLYKGDLQPEDIALLPRTESHFPLKFHQAWGPAVFTQDHVVAVVLAVLALAALAVFLRRSLAGTAIRANSENSERAAQLGIGTASLGTLVWAIAGGLAALSSVLNEPLHNGSVETVVTGGSAALGAGVLLRGLAAAVLARLEDLPVAVAAAVGISVFERCVFWATGKTSMADLTLLLVIGGALLLQRRNLSRSDESATSTWAAAAEIRPIPALLAALPAVQTGRRWALAVLALLVAGYPWVMSPSQVYLGGTFGLYGIVAVSLVVLTGWGGQISLGQFGLVAVGAATGGALSHAGVPFPLAVLGAAFCGAAVAMLLGLPALRIRGLYLAVTTLAFAVAMSTFVLDRDRFGVLVPDTLSRPSIGPLDFEDDRAFYYLCLAALIGTVAMAVGLRRTRTGRVLIAMRDNERAAQSFGLSLVRVRLVTFGLSGFVAAVAGVLLAHQQHAVRPEAYSPAQSIQIFLMAVIGGLGSVGGVLTGAVYLGAVTIFLPQGLGQLLASGVGVLLVLLFFPTGLGGTLFAIRDGWLRRIALRERIYVRSLLGDIRLLDREKAPLSDPVTPEQQYEIASAIREAGASQRGKGWVYQ